MAAPGRYFGVPFPFGRRTRNIMTQGTSSFAMPSVNNAIHARFTATSTRDIKSIYVNWGTISAAGTVELRIETIDATTGKPTGTLYDANATKSFTPVNGWQNVAFDTTPTAGLTSGTEYSILFITTGAGTTHNFTYLNAGTAFATYPLLMQSASDGSTRSNFADVANSVPILTVVYDDDVEEPLLLGFGGPTNSNIFSGNAAGAKIVVPSTITVVGYEIFVMRTGSPAGDLVIKTWNSSDAVVTDSTVTIDKDSITGLSTKGTWVRCVPFTLAAGTYRIIAESQDSVNSSNCWGGRYVTTRTAAMNSSGRIFTSTTNISGTPPTWSDNSDRDTDAAFVIDDLTVSGGGGLLRHPGMSGGMLA